MLSEKTARRVGSADYAPDTAHSLVGLCSTQDGQSTRKVLRRSDCQIGREKTSSCTDPKLAACNGPKMACSKRKEGIM